MGELKEYTLGSGHLHLGVYENTLPTWDEFFSSTENLIGRIKGGASISYTTEKYEDEDDLGYIKIEEIKKEKVEMKSGVMTWNLETLQSLCSTARSTTLADGTVHAKIGGLANQSNARYILGFEHKDKGLRVAIVGRNTEGFSFDFKQDSVTVIDCVFSAEALDDEGTLIYIWDMRKAPVCSSIKIGSIVLSPAFNQYVKLYTATTSTAKDTITAVSKSSDTTLTIKNGETTVENDEITWAEGTNTITVSNKLENKEFIYTITVTKSTSTS